MSVLRATRRQIAATLFVAMVRREGLPRTEGDVRALSDDCYRAAKLLLSLGRPTVKTKRRRA